MDYLITGEGTYLLCQYHKKIRSAKYKRYIEVFGKLTDLTFDYEFISDNIF